MVKKLPKTKRHKKLKAVDPFYTGDRKLLLDKGLIHANQTPKKGDDEKLPMKIREYMELNEQLKARNKNKKSKRLTAGSKILTEPDSRGAEVPLRPVQKFQKSKYETDRQFLNRIDQATQSVINRSKYESQFDVKIEAKDDQDVTVKKEKKMSQKKRERLQKLKNKLKVKKLNKQLDNDDKKHSSYEKIKFGECNHQPPSITSFPKLPKNKLQTNQTKEALTIPLNKPGKNNITEKDRNVVIQRYRQMKMQGKFN